MNVSPLSTIQFSNPIPRRRHLEGKPPLNISHKSPSYQRRIHFSPRSNSVQFAAGKTRQHSAEHQLQSSIAEEKRKFEEQLASLNQQQQRLTNQLYFLQSHNEALNTRNIISLEHIVYLQDRITFEEDWYRQKMTENPHFNRI